MPQSGGAQAPPGPPGGIAGAATATAPQPPQQLRRPASTGALRVVRTTTAEVPGQVRVARVSAESAAAVGVVPLGTAPGRPADGNQWFHSAVAGCSSTGSVPLNGSADVVRMIHGELAAASKGVVSQQDLLKKPELERSRILDYDPGTIFDVLDRDHDGAISTEELAHAMKRSATSQLKQDSSALLQEQQQCDEVARRHVVLEEALLRVIMGCDAMNLRLDRLDDLHLRFGEAEKARQAQMQKFLDLEERLATMHDVSGDRIDRTSPPTSPQTSPDREGSDSFAAPGRFTARCVLSNLEQMQEWLSEAEARREAQAQRVSDVETKLELLRLAAARDSTQGSPKGVPQQVVLEVEPAAGDENLVQRFGSPEIALMELLQSVKGQASELDNLKDSQQQEFQALWDAMASHTHDINVASSQELTHGCISAGQPIRNLQQPFVAKPQAARPTASLVSTSATDEEACSPGCTNLSRSSPSTATVVVAPAQGNLPLPMARPVHTWVTPPHPVATPTSIRVSAPHHQGPQISTLPRPVVVGTPPRIAARPVAACGTAGLTGGMVAAPSVLWGTTILQRSQQMLVASRAEVSPARQSSSSLLQDAFTIADRNRDGVLSREEFKQAFGHVVAASQAEHGARDHG